ncbi:chromatin accessibility complex protein 1-like [Varroa jacobsoni]|uniref:chromatin accessibility complex protein 1-like n=1 Tax=Varroa jacobsoni TaxID=62625 RepID=UPI000BFAAD95|nr:chromatin accessibility complex protein 1-like [Varroa jacobsoni]XP_022689416.1 chromatin accessibility complex protein 1-like [Varroa jacobsoni]XP_022689417.1 chromatin accessibility complex protein 1-like [Varroa jacobsoni]
MQAASAQKRDSSGGGKKSSKSSKDKEQRNAKSDSKDAKNSKETKNNKNLKNGKETKDAHKNLKSGKETKTSKDHKKENKHLENMKNSEDDHVKEPKGVTEQDSPSRKEKGQPKASFPLTRIKMIMKSAPEVNTLGVDAVALTARAAELFVIHLAKETLKTGKTTKVDYGDIYRVVHDNPVLDFLYDIIPQKVSYKDCMDEIKEVERKQMEAMDQIEI